MEGDTIVMTDIFKYEQTGVTPDGGIIGQFKPTGIRPMFSPPAWRQLVTGSARSCSARITPQTNLEAGEGKRETVFRLFLGILKTEKNLQ